MSINPKYDTLYGEPVRILNFTMAHDPEFNPDCDPNNDSDWPSPQCTQQNQAAAGLMNLFGIHARLCDVEGHTGLEYYSYNYHKWIWCDATFNEHYVQVQSDGSRIPLGALDLNRLTLYGRLQLVEVVKHGYPTDTYPENIYLKAHPRGFRQYAPTLYMRNFGGQGCWLSRFDTHVYSPNPPASYLPILGESIHFDRAAESGGWYYWPKTSSAQTIDYPLDCLAVASAAQPTQDGISFAVVSYLPYTTRFEVRYQNDTSWNLLQRISSIDSTPAVSNPTVLNWEVGNVRLRAVDNVGNVTRELIVDLPQ